MLYHHFFFPHVYLAFTTTAVLCLAAAAALVCANVEKRAQDRGAQRNARHHLPGDVCVGGWGACQEVVCVQRSGRQRGGY